MKSTDDSEEFIYSFRDVGNETSLESKFGVKSRAKFILNFIDKNFVLKFHTWICVEVEKSFRLGLIFYVESNKKFIAVKLVKFWVKSIMDNLHIS